MRVLVTRPEKEGRATAARLEALGHEAMLEPVTTIVAVEHPVLPAAETVQAVTATSLNAVEVLIGRDDIAALRAKPFFAVGARTARAAREAGFIDVRSAEGDRRDLVREIVAGLDPAAGAILWLVGRDRAGDLVADLGAHGFTVEAVEVYRAEPVARLSEATRAALAAGRIDAAMVFSPRSGAILLERLGDLGFRPASLDFSVHAISEAAARPFREAGWREVVVASSPDSDAMIATLGPAPVSATPGEDDIRSSEMPPKSDKGRSETEAAIEAPATEPAAQSEETAAETTGRVEPETTPEGIAGTATETDTLESAPAAAAEPSVADPIPEPKLAPAPAAPAAPAAAKVEPSAPQVTVIRKGGFGLALVATLLGGVAGVGGTYALALKGLLPGGDGSRVAALEATIAEIKAKPAPVDAATAERLAALEKRLGDVAAAKPAAPADVSGLEGRIAKLEMMPPPAADLSGLEGRLAKLETAPKPAVDLSGVEGRIAKLESTPAPAPSLPGDLAERIAALEAAAKARLEAAQTSIAGALQALPQDGAAKETLDTVATRVDQAIGALKENAGAEIAALKARLEKLGGGLDADSKALAEKLGSDTRALGDKLAGEARGLSERLAVTVEDLKKRNDEFARVFSERVGAALATSDAEARKRGEELAKAMSERLAALSQAVEGEFQKRNGEIGAALEALKQRLGAVEGLRGELEAALGRVAALETGARQAGDTGQKLVEKVGEAAASAQGKLGALETRLAGIEAGAEATRKAQAEAVIVMALADLRAAVDAGRPFATELAVVETAAKGGLDLSALKSFAAEGVPGAAKLRDGWPALRRAVVAAGEAKSADAGVFDRLWANATGVVKVRPTGESAGDGVAAIVGRLEARLAAGDLGGAFDQWQALPEAARKASAEWGAALGARVSVDRALAAQTAAMTAKLTQQSQ